MDAREFRVHLRGIWVPQVDDVARLRLYGPRPEGGAVYDVEGRHPKVVLIRRGDAPLGSLIGRRMFVDLRSEILGDGPVVRRAVHVYPEPSAEAVDQGPELDFDYLIRPIGALEAVRASRSLSDLSISRRGNGQRDRLCYVGRGEYLLEQDGTELILRDPMELARRADESDWRMPEVQFRDWQIDGEEARRGPQQG